MEWFEIEISLAPSMVDAVSCQLFDLGTLGVTEAGTDTAPLLRAYFDKSEVERVKKAIEAYCKSLEAIFPNEVKPLIRYASIKDTGWSEKYKEHYKAQKLSHEFYLIPAWDQTSKVPNDMIPIKMEPGQAFGTGLHPSTRLSLRLIEYVIEKSLNQHRMKVMDVGTGSGILAIACRKLGAGDVQGVDIDPVAVETAKENCVLNECQDISISDKPFSEFKTPFDLVISNILLEAHIELAKHYQRLTKADGFLIVSGLLGNQRLETIRLLESHGFKLVVSEAFQEWAAFLFARRGGV